MKFILSVFRIGELFRPNIALRTSLATLFSTWPANGREFQSYWNGTRLSTLVNFSLQAPRATLKILRENESKIMKLKRDGESRIKLEEIRTGLERRLKWRNMGIGAAVAVASSIGYFFCLSGYYEQHKELEEEGREIEDVLAKMDTTVDYSYDAQFDDKLPCDVSIDGGHKTSRFVITEKDIAEKRPKVFCVEVPDDRKLSNEGEIALQRTKPLDPMGTSTFLYDEKLRLGYRKSGSKDSDLPPFIHMVLYNMVYGDISKRPSSPIDFDVGTLTVNLRRYTEENKANCLYVLKVLRGREKFVFCGELNGFWDASDKNVSNLMDELPSWMFKTEYWNVLIINAYSILLQNKERFIEAARIVGAHHPAFGYEAALSNLVMEFFFHAHSYGSEDFWQDFSAASIYGCKNFGKFKKAMEIVAGAERDFSSEDDFVGVRLFGKSRNLPPMFWWAASQSRKYNKAVQGYGPFQVIPSSVLKAASMIQMGDYYSLIPAETFESPEAVIRQSHDPLLKAVILDAQLTQMENAGFGSVQWPLDSMPLIMDLPDARRFSLFNLVFYLRSFPELAPFSSGMLASRGRHFNWLFSFKFFYAELIRREFGLSEETFFPGVKSLIPVEIDYTTGTGNKKKIFVLASEPSKAP